MAAVDTAAAAAAVVMELRSTYSSGRTKSFEWRVSQLEALLTIATRHEREIVEALRSDLNKPEIEAFLHEIYPVASACRFALQELNRWTSPEKAKTSILSFPSSAEIISEPLGVVLVISTWNYPFLLSLEPVIGAIAAGNAVVLKPSEVAPTTSAVLAKLLGQYMDASAVRVVEGAVPQTTALLHQKWDKIFYTGSGKVGRIILAAAAKHLTPVVLELGGKCPTVVDPNTNLKIAPTIMLDVPGDSLVMNEEIFGPLLPIVTVDEIKDSFSVINAKEKPLAAYLFTNDRKLKDEFVKNISAGGMVINDTVIHVTERGLPFGGVGESGMGAYHGKFSFDAFSHRKALLKRSFGGDADIRYPPYTAAKQQLLRTLVQGNVFGILRALIGC